jgi:hypothetical protein
MSRKWQQQPKDGQRIQHQRHPIVLKLTEIAVLLKEAASTTQRGAKRRSPEQSSAIAASLQSQTE